jgi:hypothetical protein
MCAAGKSNGANGKFAAVISEVVPSRFVTV